MSDQISAGEGRTAPKTPLPWCSPHPPPAPSPPQPQPGPGGARGTHEGGGETPGNPHQTPFTEGAGRAQVFWGAISGVPSCQCQPRWGSLGLRVPLFPPHSPLLTPPLSGTGGKQQHRGGCGTARGVQRGAEGDPTTLTPLPGAGGVGDTLRGDEGSVSIPRRDHVAQFRRLPAPSLLFILSGIRAGAL